MLRRVALVSDDVTKELSASETSILTIATRRNIPKDAILLITRLCLRTFILHLVLPPRPPPFLA
jgi:hypothetical protein